MRKRSNRKVKPVVLPLGIKRLDLIEMPGHVALIALGQDWMKDSHYADLVTACYLGIDLSEPDSEIRQMANRGIELIKNNCTDYDEIRRVIGAVIQWVSSQSNVEIYKATCNRLKHLNRMHNHGTSN